jgi:hypothetical protein
MHVNGVPNKDLRTWQKRKACKIISNNKLGKMSFCVTTVKL